MLATTRYGPPSGTPLLIAHGLFGSARNWGVIAKRLSETRPVLAVDMRNHGESPRAETHSYPDLAADLAEVISAHGGRADVLGHSMGGKAAMALALTEPACVNRLIVADIAPVAYSHTQMPFLLAMQDLPLEGLSSRGQADERLAETIDDPAIRAFLLQSLDLKAMPPRWRLNLPVLKHEMDTILGWPGLPGPFDGPVLFLSGGASEYVKREDREAIRTLFPSARFAKIPDAGHWLHAERPRDFAAAALAFLDA